MALSKPEGSPRRSRKSRSSEPDGKRPKSNKVSAVTAYPTLAMFAYVTSEAEVSSLFSEFHMTIKPRVTNLTSKQASMLLSIAVSRAVHIGVDLTLYMALKFLYDYLVKSGHDPLEEPNDKIRHTVLVAELVMVSIKGEWFDLRSYEILTDQVAELIINTGWLPDDRTLNSWKQFWDLEKFLAVKIVPVEQFLERNKQSAAERYSSYTRGYGQDGNTTEPGRTKPSPELDGDDSVPRPPRFTLLEFEQYVTVLNQIEIEKAKKAKI